MTVQLEWGQRPEWSFDGKRIYFLPRAFANIFRIDASIGKIELITAHFFHGDCHRVFFPANGDLLAGSAKFDADIQRNSDKNFVYQYSMPLLANLLFSPCIAGKDNSFKKSTADLQCWTIKGKEV